MAEKTDAGCGTERTEDAVNKVCIADLVLGVVRAPPSFRIILKRQVATSAPTFACAVLNCHPPLECALFARSVCCLARCASQCVLSSVPPLWAIVDLVESWGPASPSEVGTCDAQSFHPCNTFSLFPFEGGGVLNIKGVKGCYFTCSKHIHTHVRTQCVLASHWRTWPSLTLFWFHTCD